MPLRNSKCTHIANLDDVAASPKRDPYTLREDSYLCGPEGKWFIEKIVMPIAVQQKEETSPKRKSWFKRLFS